MGSFVKLSLAELDTLATFRRLATDSGQRTTERSMKKIVKRRQRSV